MTKKKHPRKKWKKLKKKEKLRIEMRSMLQETTWPVLLDSTLHTNRKRRMKTKSKFLLEC